MDKKSRYWLFHIICDDDRTYLMHKGNLLSIDKHDELESLYVAEEKILGSIVLKGVATFKEQTNHETVMLTLLNDDIAGVEENEALKYRNILSSSHATFDVSKEQDVVTITIDGPPPLFGVEYYGKENHTCKIMIFILFCSIMLELMSNKCF